MIESCNSGTVTFLLATPGNSTTALEDTLLQLTSAKSLIMLTDVMADLDGLDQCVQVITEFAQKHCNTPIIMQSLSVYKYVPLLKCTIMYSIFDFVDFKDPNTGVSYEFMVFTGTSDSVPCKERKDFLEKLRRYDPNHECDTANSFRGSSECQMKKRM